MKIRFIGQSTFRIILKDGLSLLTDPWFGTNWFLRAVPPALRPEQLEKIDLILSSHNHLDHIDRFTLRAAKKWNSIIVGPPGIFRRAQRNGLQNAHSLKPDEKLEIFNLEIIATPAFHPLSRDAVGFWIKTEEKIIYFSGDTRFTAPLKNWLQAHSPIHLAFLQIACARYFGKDDGLNLTTASELAKSFAPETLIPMHYHGRFKQADPHILEKLLSDTGIKTLVIKLGEEIEI